MSSRSWPAGRKRSRAREIALQALYQFDLRRKAEAPSRAAEDLEGFVARAAADPAVGEYARCLVSGVLEALDDLDARIASAVEHWKIDRVAPIDRCALRLGLFELLRVPDVPPRVAINEAIELVKKYSTEQSGAFVNGVLDRLLRDLGSGEESGGEDPRGEGLAEGESDPLGFPGGAGRG